MSDQTLEQMLEQLAEKYESVTLERDSDFRNGLWECIVDDDNKTDGATHTTPTGAVSKLLERIKDE